MFSMKAEQLKPRGQQNSGGVLKPLPPLLAKTVSERRRFDGESTPATVAASASVATAAAEVAPSVSSTRKGDDDGVAIAAQRKGFI